MKKTVIFGLIFNLSFLFSCGLESEPLFSPQLIPNEAVQDPFDGGLMLTIFSSGNVRYTHAVDNIPIDPNCSVVGNVYNGSFLIGGPEETINIKAIACQGSKSSGIATGTYTFGN